MPAEIFSGPQTPNAPAIRAAAVTPGTTELSPTRGLYIGGAGDLVVVMAGEPGDATSVTFTGVLAGCILPLQVRKVLSSSTATLIVALY